ncbi:MAG: cysteine--tRNA ligase [Candidatus Saccharimonadales bacterium]
MKLYDTASNNYRIFAPAKHVGIYVCGITPYDAAHLGHIFTFLTYDLLQRRLEDNGHTVLLVRNITDVDEPIYKRAKQQGIDYSDLANEQIKLFQHTMKQLNFRPATAEPRASEYIQQMAMAIDMLVKRNHAYYLDNDIYFDISTSQEFQKFAGLTEKLQRALAQLRGGDTHRHGKHHPLDFLLWRDIADPADTAQWTTLLGNGRPGWHIECSVMSAELLGPVFDIHGGGSDLIFPHHSAEIAQSYSLHHKMPADLWLHVAPLLYLGEKMSKSLGNLVFAADLLQHYEPSVIRLALMHYHHRIGGEWQAELLLEASELLERLKVACATASAAQSSQLLIQIRQALDDDLNTLAVIDAIHEFINHRAQAPIRHTHAATTTALQLLGLNF